MEPVLIASSVLLWVVVLFNLLLTLALVRRLNTASKTGTEMRATTSKGPNAGQIAPPFTAETLQGDQVTLEDYSGRSAAFVFIATGCTPCKEALPSYEALYPKAQRAGVDLVLVSVDNAERTRAFVEEFNIRVPILIAPQASNPFMKDYNFEATPSYCLVDAQGRVQSAGFPSLEWGEWKALAESWDEKQRKASVAGMALTG